MCSEDGLVGAADTDNSLERHVEVETGREARWAPMAVPQLGPLRPQEYVDFAQVS